MRGGVFQFARGHRRWLIVVLLAAFSVVNYLDRQALSVLAPTLRQELGISTVGYVPVFTGLGFLHLTAFVLLYLLQRRSPSVA
jgi:ACS family hexuronate transporter-like MFS transporter